ncbi:hypothetical protein LTR85_003549 [Meristemomyces frigidus]|nr:hypothetical protein LTR85_003549 [Meristemomyces frigidus]
MQGFFTKKSIELFGREVSPNVCGRVVWFDPAEIDSNQGSDSEQEAYADAGRVVFGFLTFRDPKVVNTVFAKEHTLDGKLVHVETPYIQSEKPNKRTQIDPKLAIPHDEQERTAKISVGGVS